MTHLGNAFQYDFEGPLLIYQDRLFAPGPDYWELGEKWIEQLKESRPSELKGIVLPLEIKRGHRQRLWGVDLLNWLRWSGAETFRYVPVLATAWQPLGKILRKKPNLLLIAEGTRFVRLPECVENERKALAEFVSAARTGDAESCKWKTLEEYAASGSDDVARFTHHDLANDFYGAYRLWRGYLAALEAAGGDHMGKGKDREIIEEEYKRATEITGSLACEGVVTVKKAQPWFQQYQALAKSRPLPDYPDPGFPLARFVRHVRDGLPPNVRVLFIDDEFDKGMAEVLLEILFRSNAFPPARQSGRYGEERKAQAYQNEVDKEKSEWVYRDETERVRVVCVKDIIAARNWLYLWGDLEYPPLPMEKEKENQEEYAKTKKKREDAERALNCWRRTWEQARGQTGSVTPEKPQRLPTPLELARHTFVELGLHHYQGDKKIAHRKLKTIVLLDLRLTKSPGGEDRPYNPAALSSVVLRREVYENNRHQPVLIFTASRNAINVSAMADAGRVDGWIWKEAPDVPEDDGYSRRVVESLLGRIYKHSAAPPGYRDLLNWDADPHFREFKQTLGEMSEERRAQCSILISEESNRLFNAIKLGAFAKQFRSEQQRRHELKFWGFIQSMVPHERVIQWLIARRVATAAYFYAGSAEGDTWRRDVPKLAALIGLKPPNKKDKDNASKVIAFQRDLALPYVEGKILSQLLPEEIEWLLKQSWDKQKRAILAGAKNTILLQSENEE